MRRAYNDVEAVTHEDKVIGVSLGYDFCAEHEWGIKGIKQQLGLKEPSRKCLGIQNKLIRTPEQILHGEFNFWMRKGTVLSPTKKQGYSQKTAYYFETADSVRWAQDPEERRQQNRTGLISTYDIEESRKDLWSEWDKDDFRIVTTNKELYDCLVGALEASMLTLGLGAQSNPFANSGLLLLDARTFPEESIKEMAEQELESIKFHKRADKVKRKIDKKLKRADLSYYSLKARPMSKEEQKEKGTKYDMWFWLNPSEQRIYDSGWYTAEELFLWAKGEGPIIKQHEAKG